MNRGLGGLSQVGGYCKVDGEAIYLVGKKKCMVTKRDAEALMIFPR